MGAHDHRGTHQGKRRAGLLVACLLSLLLVTPGRASPTARPTSEIGGPRPVAAENLFDNGYLVARMDITTGLLEFILGADGAEPVSLAVAGLDCGSARACRLLAAGQAGRVVSLLSEEPAADQPALSRTLALAMILDDHPRQALGLLSTRTGSHDHLTGNIRALALLALGRTPEAERELQRAIAAQPRAASTINTLAVASMLQHRPERAARLFRRAAETGPDLFSPRFDGAVLAWQRGRPDLAVELFRQARMRTPGFGQAYLFEGLAELAAGRPVAASAALLRARELGLDGRRLHLALGLAGQELELHPLAAHHLARALAMSQSGNQDRLVDKLATSLVRLDKLPQAAAVLEQGFSRTRRDADQHFLLGLKLLLCEQPQRATRYLLRAVAMGRRRTDGYFALGQALVQSGLLPEGLRALKLAELMSPDSPETKFALAVALFRSGELGAAVERLRQAARLAPQDTDILGLLLEFSRRHGDAAVCRAAAHRLLELRPQLLAPRFALAQCQALSGELERARETMADALDRDSGGEQALEARQQLQALAHNRAGLAGAHLLLAMIHEHRGDWDRAVRALERFILVAPSPDWTRWAVRHLHRLLPPPR